MYYSTCQLYGILFPFKFSHKQHVCTAFYQCNDGTVISSSYDSIHLEVPKALAVSFCRSFADACSVGYGYASAPDRSGTMLLACDDSVGIVPSFCLVFTYHTVYGFMTNILAIIGQCTRYLFRDHCSVTRSVSPLP